MLRDTMLRIAPQHEAMCGLMGAYVYILRCADGKYYTGSTRGSLEVRIAQHDAGSFEGYTAQRRPLDLVWHQQFAQISDAVAAERQIKGWSRAKKTALIEGDYKRLRQLARKRKLNSGPHPEVARSAVSKDV